MLPLFLPFNGLVNVSTEHHEHRFYHKILGQYKGGCAKFSKNRKPVHFQRQGVRVGLSQVQARKIKNLQIKAFESILSIHPNHEQQVSQLTKIGDSAVCMQKLFKVQDCFINEQAILQMAKFSNSGINEWRHCLMGTAESFPRRSRHNACIFIQAIKINDINSVYLENRQYYYCLTLMSRKDVLLFDYSLFLTQRASKNSEPQLLQFKNIIQSFTHRNQQLNQKYRYLSLHVQFLFEAVSCPSQASNKPFTAALQLLNHLLRSSLLQHFKIPINLHKALAFHLCLNSNYKHSSAVVANVIWLICRCLQVCGHRELFMRSMSESGVLENCLQSKQMDFVSQRGVLLLLNYVCKHQLERKQIYLTVLRNISKFSEVQMRSQIFALLRKDRALRAIQQAPQCQQQLRRVLELYLNHSQVAQTFLSENQRLVILATNFEECVLDKLKIQKILQLYMSYSTIDLQQYYLTKIFEICEKVFQSEQKLDRYLNLALKTLYSNKISRRIFVQHHQRVSYKQFVDILKGEYPKKLSTSFLSADEGNNRLKFLICMKRISKRLKVETFYNYKLKPFVEKHLRPDTKIQLNEQLVELLKDVTQRDEKSQIV